jgi:hypothetical protein
VTVFWLGLHQPRWLDAPEARGVPVCYSLPRLIGLKRLRRAGGPVFLDGGGFTEITRYGGWRSTPAEYAASIARVAAGIGSVVHAAPQDWMCEPVALQATGLTVGAHQARTVWSLRELRARAPEVPWLPVLQGQTVADYLTHLDLYGAAGIDLRDAPLVGVGTLCRRQHTAEALEILVALSERGLRLHGFGLKLRGLAGGARYLASADSMAWSYHARRRPPFCGSTTHMNCANCLTYALRWRDAVLAQLAALPG